MNPTDEIQRRLIDDLIPYARNSRTHSDAQVAQIAASIKEWGWTMPILIDEQGGIIAGHGRVLAARSLGHEDVPVVVAKGWSESKKRAYVIADNKLALNAGWDFEMLASEIEELNSDGYELDLIGFNAEEMDKVINPVVDTPPEDFNEYGDDIETEYKCPKCSYEWSGKAK
jgi:ParB-like chromosome segregation protein Spo0J